MPRYRRYQIEGNRIKIGEVWFPLGPPDPVQFYDTDGNLKDVCYHGKRNEKTMYKRAKGYKAYRHYCFMCKAVWYEVFE